LPQPLQERRQTGLAYRIVLGVWHEHADASHPLALLRAHRERPRRRRAAECGQQFPPSDGDCHTPLPREVRRGKNTTPRARCLHVVLREPPWTAGGQKCSQLFLVEHGARRGKQTGYVEGKNLAIAIPTTTEMNRAASR